jgi:hypothetical protein
VGSYMCIIYSPNTLSNLIQKDMNNTPDPPAGGLPQPGGGGPDLTLGGILGSTP